MRMTANDLTTLFATHQVAPAPPPWQLRGDGYILLYKFPPALGGQAGFVPSALQPHFRGGVGAVMYVDYTETPVGPYQELLFIPGFFDFQGESYPSISKIYVSTWESILNGRDNWRIPKEEAHMSRYQRGQTERVIIWNPDNELIAELTLHNKNLTLPLTTAVLPPRLRTVVQNDPVKTFATTLAGRGWMQPTQLLQARVNPAYFPDFTQGRLLTAVHVTDFHLTFPTPTFGPPLR